MKHILFVCLGNICRSTAAQAVFQSMVDERGLTGDFHIDSAGTYGGHTGQMADPRMQHHAMRRGYKLTHRARRITAQDFEQFDLIMAMDDSNYHNLLNLAPTPEDKLKVERMATYITKHPHFDHVPDPYYEGAEGFELVLDLLEDACSTLLDKLTQS